MRKQRVEELASISDMALKLRESATDVTEALSDVETYLQILNNMAIEVSTKKDDILEVRINPKMVLKIKDKCLKCIRKDYKSFSCLA